VNLPHSFETYISEGIVKKCSVDKQRAMFLVNEAKNSFEGLKERIEKIDINIKNANSIVKDCYDILMELIRAELLLNSYNASGQRAHEAEVAFLGKQKFPDNEVSFMNDLRFFRNSACYYGKILDEDYAKQVVEFTYKFYPLLIKRFNF